MCADRKTSQLLAESLRIAKSFARGESVVKSDELGRQHRERLIASGCLSEIIRGWYLLTSPNSTGSTAWFGGFWAFVKYYLDERFGNNEYCLSAETSANIHAGDTSIPSQIIILTKKASNSKIDLPHDTSILLVTDSKNFPEEFEDFNGIQLMTIPMSLCRITPSYYINAPRNIEIILKMSSLSVADIVRTLLKFDSSAAASRIVGAYKHFGEEAKANQIKEGLTVAGYTIKEISPFDNYVPKLGESRMVSPYAGRIRLMWNTMKSVVERVMPEPPGFQTDRNNTIRLIQETYKQDAYHSLSIEGYKVTEELISKIESGEWDPENIEADKKHLDALTAKGYLNAFNAVIESVKKVLNQENSGEVLSNDLQTWYRELFSPFVIANIFKPEQVAGYRDQPVYIKNARHVPPPKNAVLDCMDVLFELLKKEKHAGVKAVLGHFIFVFIHPYMDGNGRIGRFIMNLMLISGGYSWTVIRTENRDRYMKALELASTKEDIEPFAEFIKFELDYWTNKS